MRGLHKLMRAAFPALGGIESTFRGGILPDEIAPARPRGFADRHGWVVARIFEDASMPDANGRDARPGLDAGGDHGLVGGPGWVGRLRGCWSCSVSCTLRSRR
jgi:hypothetical protein